MELDLNVKKLISVFESENHKAYVVGGCVRSYLMNSAVNDIDIAVSCPPQQTIEILQKNGIRTIETGLKHGTVTALMSGTPYEITTFRTELGYTDGRHPDSVQFVTTINDDLSRRDFTVNAMAYNQTDGLIDLFGGKNDIANKIIKTVGNPNTRFNEDALRILRALRFSSTLGFKIERKTARSVLKNKKLILSVSKERITQEFLKMLAGDNIKYVILNFYKVLNVVFAKKYKKRAYITLAKNIEKVPKVSILRLVFCYVCLSGATNGKKFKISSPIFDNFNAFLSNFSLSNEQILTLKGVLYNINKDMGSTTSNVQKQMYQIGDKTVKNVLAVQGAVLNVNASISAYNIVIDSRLPYQLSHLDINGNDLIELGYCGPQIKLKLEKLLFDVIDGKVLNNRKSLIEQIKNATK